MLFSFIIPCYNSQKTVRACLESLLLQSKHLTEVEYEIIVVDNASTDETAKTIRELGIEPLYLHERSRSKARNAGSRVARGRYLCFIDSDIVLHPNWLKNAHNIITQRPQTKIIGFPFFLLPPKSQSPATRYHFEMELIKAQIPRTTLHSLFINTKCCLYEKELFFNLGGFDEDLKWYEDMDLSRRALMEDYYLENKKLSSVIDTEVTIKDLCKKAYFSGKETIFYHIKWDKEDISELFLQMVKRGHSIYLYFRKRNLSYLPLLCFFSYLAGLTHSMLSPKRILEAKRARSLLSKDSWREVRYQAVKADFIFNGIDLKEEGMPKINLQNGNCIGKTDLFINPSYKGRFTGSGRHLQIGHLIIKGAGLSLIEHKKIPGHSSGILEKREAYREFVIGKVFETFNIFPKYYTLGKYNPVEYFIVRSGEAPRIAQLNLEKLEKSILKAFILLKAGNKKPFAFFLQNFFSPFNFNLVHHSINVHNVNILGQFVDLNSFDIYPNDIRITGSHLEAMNVVVSEALNIYNFIFNQNIKLKDVQFDHPIYKLMQESNYEKNYVLTSPYFQPLSMSLNLLDDQIMDSKDNFEQFLNEAIKHQRDPNGRVA